jgi:Txe/YoeB family toxin of Txe-Axe toxin-antitoxin module
MVFKDKEVRVILEEEVNEVYKELNEIVGGEIKKGILKSEHQVLLKSINRAIELLKNNPFIGIQIPKRLIPKKYIEKFDVTNLWKFNLANYWRMIYTVTSEEIKIISFILDIVDHKTYDRLFGYKK